MLCSGQYESIMVVNDPDTQVPHPACTNGTCANCKPLVRRVYSRTSGLSLDCRSASYAVRV